MKPAPPKKPIRIRVVLTYTIPAHLYVSLVHESSVLDDYLRKLSRIVKGSKFELARWGSKKPCRVVPEIDNYKSNKHNINTDVKIDSGKVKRHLDFGAMKSKK